MIQYGFNIGVEGFQKKISFANLEQVWAKETRASRKFIIVFDDAHYSQKFESK